MNLSEKPIKSFGKCHHASLKDCEQVMKLKQNAGGEFEKNSAANYMLIIGL